MFWLYFGLGLPVLLGLAGLIVGFIIGLDSGLLGGVGVGVGVGFIAGLVGFLVGIIPITYAQTQYNERTLTCEVTGKDRGGKEDDMRVYTSCGTFANVDSVWRGKHNSADLWAKIHEGHTYQFDVAGWRLGFTSDFPNIFKVNEVNQ